jgi:cellulose synthase (UDP-forming)
MREELQQAITKIKPPLRSEIKTIRVLICCGIFSMCIFINWFIDPEHVGYSPIFWLLTFALVFKLLKMLHEWYHYWDLSVPVPPDPKREWKVDVLTTACPGEPQDMIIRTLKAMVAISYPHTNYLCDEGNDPLLKKVCSDLGVIHVTRTEKINAKAGNINNALRQASGEIAVVLDPDHVPVPEFLDRVLAYFEDPSIGYVQCVQAYGNQKESFIARGAAEQTYHFYGPMMMCMNSYGTVQAIGANCTFRRSALDSIGGHAAGLAEDMHTAMQLHAKGWRSVYVPELLTRGLVPATLSAYYKQQLKWSRGVFELLFRTFPKLCKNFTWRQKFHYLTIPMYFLFGLINFIDIIVPVLALGMAQVPWEVDLANFALYFIPLCVLSLCIRLYAQRWLLEKHERGFHFAGGILRMATWWIFLTGFIYSIFNVKVPYIPTPKEDEHQNFIKLSVPNLIILLLCGIFIWYGLSIDWTPYSIAMAGYSFLSISMLGLTIFLSQQKFLMRLRIFCKRLPVFNSLVHFFDTIISGIQQIVYSVLKQGVIVLILAFSMVFLSYNTKENGSAGSAPIEKDPGGFYLGTEFTTKESESGSNFTENNFNFLSFIFRLQDTAQKFPASVLTEISKQKAIPYMVLEAEIPDRDIWREILSGKLDPMLKRYAAAFRTYREPVFFSLISSEKNTNFISAWQYVYTFFTELGVSNLTWVWRPNDANEEKYYPGEKFVDWIGLKCLNYAGDSDPEDRFRFSLLYENYRKAYGKFEKPVMVAELGSVRGKDQINWISDALTDIREKYKEVRSVMLKNSEEKISYDLGNGPITYIADFSYIERAKEIVGLDQFKLFVPNTNELCKTGHKYRSAFVSGSPGKFELMVNNGPFYIKGVAYNTAHDWRDGNMPLTRRQVLKDFQHIKEMGANTIRRYGTGIYDRNVLNIAEEMDLKVLFGFWFDPKTDFYKDSLKVKEYISEVEEKVRKHKDHSSILAWSLGNESWGLLKHNYGKPYLTKVRASYIQLIEYLAQRIHQLDPGRPVFSCIEHEEYQLAGELAAFRDGAPSVDVIGINSYYEQQISKLNKIVCAFDTLRPYLVSEFGPFGYWDPKYNQSNGSSIKEQSDNEKSEWYKEQWSEFVYKNRGSNVGGFAYCWHDRMEGSYTWFGLTDFKGRLKPSYFALKELWTNKNEEHLPQLSIEGPQQLIPGTVCTFTAFTNEKQKEELFYEWKLMKNEYLEPVKNISREEDPAVISVTIPKEASDYRLYVFVTDKEERKVSTASFPIKVSQKMLP